jgi:coiled-coil domain-containing protein 55
MNISLSKGKKEKLAFGLNSRREGVGQATNVFGNDEDSDDNDGDGRAAVNRDLRAEQEALRKRAAASIEAVTAEYDYDGVYDEMHAASTKKRTELKEKKSRYVGDLLKASKQRERERDVIHERKVAKEQAQEEAEHLGKEKFVTKAYKQKLAERELWAQEEEAKRLKEEEEDVTKKTGDGAFASFYGNFNRNVAMGGGTAGKEENTSNDDTLKDQHTATMESEKPAASLGFMDGFEQAALEASGEENDAENKSSNSESAAAPPSPASMRRVREEKLAKARIRYFQRQGISEEDALQKKQ